LDAFYYKVPLIQIPSLGQGKGIFALHSYMTRLDFVMGPSFQCPDEEASDVAFVKATPAIGGWDAVEEYMACGLFPLSTSFNFGKIAVGETLVSKLTIPLPDFSVARRLEETNVGFRARVELAVVNVIGWYAHGEHKVCVEMILNGGQVDKVFEQAGVPCGTCMEPSSKACKEDAKKRKSNIGARPSGKWAKVSGQKAIPAKASVAPRGVSVAPSKTVLARATHATQASSASVAPGTSVPPRAATPSGTVGVRPPSASVTPCDVLVRQPVAARVDADRMAYCVILDYIPSAESCSSSSNDSSSSKSVMALPPMVPDLHIFVELPHMIEVPEAEAAE
jgi:hypothetical protein